MASNGVKMETGYVKSEPGYLKGEPGAEDVDMADIDEVGGYEDDTGELIFGKQISTAWLMRLPKDLWSMLSSVDEDQEIQIGEIKIWEPVGKEKEKVRFQLKPQLPKKDLRLVPKQYDLTPSAAAAPKNTFVFSEKNMPGFRPRPLGTNRAGNPDVLNSIDSREGAPKIVRRRGPRTIPKRTEYAGTVVREYNCNPRDNEEYRKIEYLKRTKGVQPRTSFIKNVADSVTLHNQGMLPTAGEESFIHTTARRRAQDNKATRMPEYELLDELDKLFKQFKFWPMSALKQRLKQPEAWLKECLSKVAVLVKTGTAANHYTLKPENMVKEEEFIVQGVKSEEMAPEVKDEDVDDEDDADLELEDVQ